MDVFEAAPFMGFLVKKSLYWSLKDQTLMVQSHWDLTYSTQLFKKAWPCWEFCWYWEVHINAIERVEKRRNEKTFFFRGKKGWSYFSFAGQTGQYLLFSKSLSIFWKKCFCFKTQRISCEPNKLYLFSLPRVFHIKYWNKKLVPLGHLLQYSEFIVAKSLISFRRERLFFTGNKLQKHFWAVIAGSDGESSMKNHEEQNHGSCIAALLHYGTWLMEKKPQEWDRNVKLLCFKTIKTFGQALPAIPDAILVKQSFSHPFIWNTGLVEEFSD